MSNEPGVQGLHWIKTAIDKIGTAGCSGDKQLVSAYSAFSRDGG